MSEPLLDILKYCLLALLYLFFLRVLQAVWVEVSGPKQRAARSARPRQAAAPAAPSGRAKGRRGAAPSVLRVIEPEAERGRSFPLADELTVGRAAGCQVTLDDTYVSQLHARVFRREGKLFVEDLGSTNGTYLNRAKVAGPMVMSSGDRLQVGSVVLELA
ncbi:FHA domain-containing protein [Actinomarinicola tropica]|uniref:FHA domain-containing protein n=1 Tax=Actinomarinicola tropica TaxID=2789776 RepID=A0A5Q2RLC2_9ACTN|nr:FHA domain-containing protein [Actinomarinicola tropica]QGG96643.1 FHA domain-containing protein [Actinomarinicola tropica]